jgi:Ca2+-binding EF-hand superfamily protein
MYNSSPFLSFYFPPNTLRLNFILKADVDGSGTLDCDEFVTMSVHLMKKISGDELLSQAFRFFDKNQNGYIEFEELRETMQDDKHGPNDDQFIEDIMFDVDLDKVILKHKYFEVHVT